MSKPTRFGPSIIRLRGQLGYSQDEAPTGEVPTPVDLLQDEDARAWYPVSGGGTTALVQSKVHTPGSSSPIIFDASFDNPVAAGSLLVILAAVRSMSGSPSISGWSALQLDTNGFNSGDGTLFYKIADGTEGTGPFAIDCITATQRRITMAEFSGPNGFVDSASTTGGASASYTIGDVTPTASSATTLIAAALNSGAITGVTGYTTVSNGLVEGGINGPASILAYKAVDPASGNYNATVTQTAVDIRGGIHVAFSDIADPIWVPAPLTVDDDDATYHEITGHTETWRAQLIDTYQVGRARLVIGCETSGSKSYVLEGQTLADIAADTGTEIGSFDFTATGSYTADDVEIVTPGADGYEFYRLVGPDENRRIFTLELYSPTALSSSDLDAHITDPTDAHDASAVSVLDSAGFFAGTDVESVLAELAGKSIGYLAHGSLGSTKTFDAATGWHSGTLNANCTFTLTAAPTGTVSSLFLELTQDGTGGWAITLPASVANKTELEADQDTTADTTSFLVLLSRDGGTTWYGGWWGGGGSDLTVEDEGTPLATAATTLDFVGSGVVASGTGAEKTITISGAPTGAAGGDLSGTYPNPSVVDDSHSHTTATAPGGGPPPAILLESGHAVPFTFDEILQESDGSDFLWASE